MYNEIARYGHIWSKNWRRKELNGNLKNTSVRIRPSPGATVKEVNHYIISTLTDNKPNTINIHGGCNDVVKKNLIL